MKSLIIATLALFASGVAYASDEVSVRNLDEGAVSPPATIEDLAWIAGHWRGEGLGGQSEEIIAPPLGGQITGMFRQTKADGSLMFYEFYHFAERDGSLVMRIKHFNPDLTGWEEKNESEEFALVAIEDGAVYFDGLTFAMTGEYQLGSAVRAGEAGEVLQFRYTRVEPAFN